MRIWTPPLSTKDKWIKEAQDRATKEQEAGKVLTEKIKEIIQEHTIKSDSVKEKVEYFLGRIITEMSLETGSIYMADRVLSEIEYQMRIEAVQELAEKLLGYRLGGCERYC